MGRQAKAPTPSARPARRIIERPRLLKQLEETDAQTILLVAPAGYGKTTLARQWADGKPTWNFSATQGSSDVAQLATDLAASLGHLYPRLPNIVDGLLRATRNPNSDFERLLDGFVRAVRKEVLTSSVGIVDNYQFIAENDAAEAFFNGVRSRLSMRLLVASRVRPSWATAREELYGHSLELGVSELALTTAESRKLIPSASSAEVEALLAQARGWPVVVGLAAMAPESGPPPPGSPKDALFRFCAEELFRAVDPSLRSQLTMLALLPNLTDEIVAEGLGRDADAVLAAAANGGFLAEALDGPELHPLIRDYLLTKLPIDGAGMDRVRSAFSISATRCEWDHAFGLARRFRDAELIAPLISAALKPLLFTGRIATLEQIARHAHATGVGGDARVALVDAELALSDGEFSRARALGMRAARNLNRNDPLASHAYWVQGQAAQLSFHYEAAATSFRLALATAQVDDDSREALWGLLLTSLYYEADDADAVLALYSERADKSELDLVRYVNASVARNRYGVGLRGHPLLEEALDVLPRVADPRVRTAFLNTCAYEKILKGDYIGASDVTKRARQEAERFQLAWVMSHIEWADAAIAMGQRRFSEADRRLKRVEQTAESLRDGHLTQNAAALRARGLLALQRPDDALRALDVDASLAAHPSMRAELLGTRALVFAALGREDAALAQTESAIELTQSVEVVSLALWARAILDPEQIAAAFEFALGKCVWDPFVYAARASSTLLASLLAEPARTRHVATALAHSQDHDLARAHGIDVPRRRGSASRLLTRREREVLELVRQGLTNAEIAKTLFISHATAKVHVRHILDKIGARTRTEAATWTDGED